MRDLKNELESESDFSLSPRPQADQAVAGPGWALGLTRIWSPSHQGPDGSSVTVTVCGGPGPQAVQPAGGPVLGDRRRFHVLNLCSREVQCRCPGPEAGRVAQAAEPDSAGPSLAAHQLPVALN